MRLIQVGAGLVLLAVGFAPATGDAAAGSRAQIECFEGVVADPDATVNGKAKAGQITVFRCPGGHQQRYTLSQGHPGVSGTPEAGDGLGRVLQRGFVNADEFPDVVAGVPGESVGSAEDAGIIQVIYGSVNGLGNGAPSLTLRQGVAGIPGGPETGDHFGAAVFLDRTHFTTPSGVEMIGYGVPHEDIGSVRDAGAAGIVVFDRMNGGVARAAAINQDSTGISGRAESGDRFGSAVATYQGNGFTCDKPGLVVGAPGEDIGSRRDTGLVHQVFDLNSDSAIGQDSAGVDGVSETGDQFGTSVTVTATCEHDGPLTVTMAVGSPGEDIASAADAGMIHLFEREDTYPATQRWSASQDSTGVQDRAETGDRFGELLGHSRRWSGEGFGEPLVVGVQRENIGTAADAGAVHVFGLETAAPGHRDRLFTQTNAGSGGTAEAGDHFGAAIAPGDDALGIGAPDDATNRTGMVHLVSWPMILGEPGGTASVALPEGPAVRFGAALAN